MQNSTLKINWTAGIALAACLVAVGCKRDSVTSYEIPKENYTPRVAAIPMGGEGADAMGAPKIRWQTPKGWNEKAASNMRVASFEIPGEDGKSADVGIIPLPSTADMESGTISMWLEDLGLPPANATKPEEVDAAGLKARLYDFTSTEPKFQDKFKKRILAAILPRQGQMWFVKMAGEESVVGRERETFIAFLKTLSFEAAPQIAGGGGGAKTNWKAPEGWQEVNAGPMLKAKFVAGEAEITVSTAGGELSANVNRWRGQFGLAPASDVDIEKDVKTIALADGTKAFAVDLTGTNPKTKRPGRLYGLIVPRGGETWFYKMTGESAAVGAQTNQLAEFAATAH